MSINENSQSELLESLSAIADGEATEFELRRILKGDEHSDLIDEKWSQYHLIGNILRKEPAEGTDISAMLSNAIKAESKPSSSNRFLKPFGQIAVAASFAAFALFGVQQYQLAQVKPTVDSGVAEAEAQISTDAVEFVSPIGFESRPQTSLVSTNPEVKNVSNESHTQVSFDRNALYEHVNDSILEHSENAAEAAQDVYPMLRAPNQE